MRRDWLFRVVFNNRLVRYQIMGNSKDFLGSMFVLGSSTAISLSLFLAGTKGIQKLNPKFNIKK